MPNILSTTIYKGFCTCASRCCYYKSMQLFHCLVNCLFSCHPRRINSSGSVFEFSHATCYYVLLFNTGMSQGKDGVHSGEGRDHSYVHNNFSSEMKKVFLFGVHAPSRKQIIYFSLFTKQCLQNSSCSFEGLAASHFFSPGFAFTLSRWSFSAGYLGRSATRSFCSKIAVSH